MKENGKKGNKEIKRQLLPLFFQSATPNKVVYFSVANIKSCSSSQFIALNNDPNITISLPGGQTAISIFARIRSEYDGCVSAIYYSDSDSMTFSEEKKLIIGDANGSEYERHFVFSMPVYWLRVDPVDWAGKFSIDELNIRVTDTDVPSSIEEKVEVGKKSSAESIGKFLEWMRDKNLSVKTATVFVTHEMSGSGAPLLLRKMSEVAKSKGISTVILSMGASADAQTNEAFQQACDTLLVCREAEEIGGIAEMLASVGIKRVVLNTVVSGTALRYFHEAGFHTTCLIHEMSSALGILKAQRWIEDYALYADKVVFPAACVRDEFIRFGGRVEDKSVILPQGYYKSIDFAPDDTSRKSILDKLGIPGYAKLIIGAGSINFRKGVDMLPVILRDLQGLGGAEYHILWLGKGEDDSYDIGLKDQILRMGMADRFHFMGYVADDQEYMAIFNACDALALVSREDPYPSVMIEAMAAGLPVVAFLGSGGAEELLTEGRGFLVGYMDLRQYALILHRICNEPDFADSVKAKAKEYIRLHGDFNAYVNRILELK